MYSDSGGNQADRESDMVDRQPTLLKCFVPDLAGFKARAKILIFNVVGLTSIARQRSTRPGSRDSP